MTPSHPVALDPSGSTALESELEGALDEREWSAVVSARLGVAVVGAGVIGRAHARVAVAHPD